MPSSDLILNVKQIAGYPPANILPADQLVLQRGGLGGAYLQVSADQLVSLGLTDAAPLFVMPGPSDAVGGQVFTDSVNTLNSGYWGWNCYSPVSGAGVSRWTAAPASILESGPNGWSISFSQSSGMGVINDFAAALVISPTGYLTVTDQVLLGRDPTFPLEAATLRWVNGQISAAASILNAYYLNATVWSFNNRTGMVILNLNDVLGAGGAPIWSPHFTGIPTAPSPSVQDNSNQIPTTQWVWQAIQSNADQFAVASFNGRTGDVVLTSADIIAAGALTSSALAPYALLASPNFSGDPTAPTPAPGDNSGNLATTAFVHAAVVASTTGVSSFNTRTGAVTLGLADITAAGGAVLNSPVFTGTPTGPTAAPGTNTQQLATTAFVLASNVTSFNTRVGAITLATADVTGAGGAVLASPAFTGTPTAPTAAPGANSTQIATTAFVAQVIAGGLVQTFNGRTGVVSLIANDVSAAGGALLASPVFTGVPAAPTAAPGTNTTQLATTAFVAAAISVAGGVTSFNGRAGVVTLLTNDITAAGGAALASPAFSGVPTAPTPVTSDNSTAIATTAYVQAAISKPATVAPLMDGTAAVGTSLLYARQDHVHPTDTSRASVAALGSYLPLAGGTLTGTLTAPNLTINGNGSIDASGTGKITSGSAGFSLNGNPPCGFVPGQSGGANALQVFNGTTSWGYVPISNAGLTPVIEWGIGAGGTSINAYYSASALVTWATTPSSDRRLKRNIEPSTLDALATINAIPVYACDLDSSFPGAKPQHWDCAIIADELEPLIPVAVNAPAVNETMPDAISYATINVLPLVATLLKAVQQLTARLTALEARLT